MSVIQLCNAQLCIPAITLSLCLSVSKSRSVPLLKAFSLLAAKRLACTLREENTGASSSTRQHTAHIDQSGLVTLLNIVVVLYMNCKDSFQMPSIIGAEPCLLGWSRGGERRRRRELCGTFGPRVQGFSGQYQHWQTCSGWLNKVTTQHQQGHVCSGWLKT